MNLVVDIGNTLLKLAVFDGGRLVAQQCVGELREETFAGLLGGAGLAGVIALLRDPAQAGAIGLGPQARELVSNTEGATDPAVYTRIVGPDPATIGERQPAWAPQSPPPG